MRSARTEARYYATVVCAAYADPRLVGPLARVALDEDREFAEALAAFLAAFSRAQSGSVDHVNELVKYGV